jgi:hypothetical protein
MEAFLAIAVDIWVGLTSLKRKDFPLDCSSQALSFLLPVLVRSLPVPAMTLTSVDDVFKPDSFFLQDQQPFCQPASP